MTKIVPVASSSVRSDVAGALERPAGAGARRQGQDGGRDPRPPATAPAPRGGRRRVARHPGRLRAGSGAGQVGVGRDPGRGRLVHLAAHGLHEGRGERRDVVGTGRRGPWREPRSTTSSAAGSSISIGAGGAGFSAADEARVGVGLATGQQVVAQGGERELVGPRVQALAEGLLGGDVGRGAADHGEPRRHVHRLAEPEVAEHRHDLRAAAVLHGAEQHVGGLHVAVQHAAVVEGGEPATDLGDDRQRLRPRQRRELEPGRPACPGRRTPSRGRGARPRARRRRRRSRRGATPPCGGSGPPRGSAGGCGGRRSSCPRGP